MCSNVNLQHFPSHLNNISEDYYHISIILTVIFYLYTFTCELLIINTLYNIVSTEINLDGMSVMT